MSVLMGMSFRREIGKVVRSSMLSISDRRIDNSLVMGWNYGPMEDLVRRFCPGFVTLDRDMATTKRQAKEGSEASLKNKGFMSTILADLIFILTFDNSRYPLLSSSTSSELVARQTAIHATSSTYISTPLEPHGSRSVP